MLCNILACRTVLSIENSIDFIIVFISVTTSSNEQWLLNNVRFSWSCFFCCFSANKLMGSHRLARNHLFQSLLWEVLQTHVNERGLALPEKGRRHRRPTHLPLGFQRLNREINLRDVVCFLKIDLWCNLKFEVLFYAAIPCNFVCNLGKAWWYLQELYAPHQWWFLCKGILKSSSLSSRHCTRRGFLSVERPEHAEKADVVWTINKDRLTGQQRQRL